MLRDVRRALLIPMVLAAVLALPARSALAADFTDVPPSHWAYPAITYVAKTNPWMQDYGPSTFNPETNEMRKFWARSLVTIFAPSEPIDPGIHFKDLPDSDPFYPYANVAVKLSWMPKYQSGAWSPNGAIQMSGMDKMLIKALGHVNSAYKDAVSGLFKLQEKDGTHYTVGELIPYLQIGRTLQFHYNHSDDTQDIQSTTLMKRDEAAHALWKAKTVQSWQIAKLDRFEDIKLGPLSGSGSDADRHDWTQYAIDLIGKHPYIFAGEWNAASPPGYCCGTQPQGGLDCSGFVWFTMKKFESNYNAAQFHPAYAGWALAERSSSAMAQYTPQPLSYGSLLVGDLMLFVLGGGSDYTDVNHVGVYAGNGWMIHQASSNNGPAIEWVGDGYYHDYFLYGRRLVGVGGPQHPITEDYATAGDIGVA